MTRRTSPSATAPTLPRSVAALTQAQLDDLLQEVAPRQGQWREEDYLWLTDCTSRRIELTDGHVEVLPMPTDDWIVDPRTETLTVLALGGAAYVEHGAFPRGARAASATFDGLTVEVGAA